MKATMTPTTHAGAMARHAAFATPEGRTTVPPMTANGRAGAPVTTVAFEHGAEIFAPGSGDGVVYRVRAGHVRLYKVLPDGRSITLALLGPGDVFTQDDVEDSYAGGVIADVLGGAVVELLDRAGFRAAIAHSPDLALETIESQERRLAALHMLIERLLARDTGVRLAATLLELAEAFGVPGPPGRVTIDLALTHQHLANMIGSNRVTVTRKLLEFQSVGAVRSAGRTSISIDPAALRAIMEAA